MPSGSMAGSGVKGSARVPFNGVVEQIQQGVDRVSQYVDTHFTVPIEVLLLLVPLVIGILRVASPPLKEYVKKRFSRMSQVVVRDIVSHSIAQYRVSGTISQDRNALLQNAIFMYLVKIVWAKKPLHSSIWRNKCSVFLLVDPFRSRVYESHCSPFRVNSSSCSDDDDLAASNCARSTSHLNRLILIKLPTSSAWIPTGVDGIEITYNRTRTRVDKAQAVKRSICLRAYGKTAAERIEDFVQKALTYYINELPLISQSSRHFFELQPPDDNSLLFKRYGMADDKNLHTVFFPERQRVMKLIDDFLFRQGRFAIEGFPYKLGFLLHGPPGTGKTAFVKALAAYTGRHVVSVPLNLLKTNQQLYDIFLNRSYNCVGESGGQKLSMKDVIFFIDGADSSNPLVRSRQAKRTVRVRRAARLTASEDDGAAAEYDEHEVEIPNAKDGPGSKGSPVKIGGTDAGTSSTDYKANLKRSIFSMFESADILDLSGLLNVLDGVVDTPGRIIVMTTNNPEMLDPALVRPGRISFKIRMDYIRFSSLVEMTGLHYGDVEPDTSVQVSDIMEELEKEVHGKVRPASPSSPKAAASFFDKQTKQEPGAAEGSVTVSPASDVAKEEEEPTKIPIGVAAARMPLRKLSEAQVSRLREAIAALESHKNSASFNFCIAPAEIEMMCAESDTLEEFIEALASFIRGEREF